MSQMEVVALDSLVPSTHAYRQFQAYLSDASEVFADEFYRAVENIEHT